MVGKNLKGMGAKNKEIDRGAKYPQTIAFLFFIPTNHPTASLFGSIVGDDTIQRLNKVSDNTGLLSWLYPGNEQSSTIMACQRWRQCFRRGCFSLIKSN